ncbi:MAG: hypothetical protein ACM3RX_00935 [Methanococcaceae archaeon]
MKAVISPKHGGARLAAAAILFIMLVPAAMASPWNFTQIPYNESQEPLVITTPYIEPIIGLLAVIAFCNFIELLIKLQSWILKGGEKKNE